MKILLIVLLFVVLAVAVVGYYLPTGYTVQESVEVRATPEEIHAHLEDLRKWPAWAPWHEQDPSIETTYGPDTVGVGARQTWTSAESGGGELELTRSDPATGIAYDMTFVDGDTRVPASASMSYQAAGDQTIVVWTMTGDMGDVLPPVAAGFMTPFLKGSIGDMFEQGLANLKRVVEAEKGS